MANYYVNKYDILAMQSHASIIDVLHDFRTSSKFVGSMIDNLITGTKLAWTNTFATASAQGGNFPFGIVGYDKIHVGSPLTNITYLLRLVANKIFAHFYNIPQPTEMAGTTQTPAKWAFVKIETPTIPNLEQFKEGVNYTTARWNQIYDDSTSISDKRAAASQALAMMYTERQNSNVIQYLTAILNVDSSGGPAASHWLAAMITAVQRGNASAQILKNLSVLINFTNDFLNKIINIWTVVPQIIVNYEGHAFGSEGLVHMHNDINTHGMVMLLVSAGLINLLNIYNRDELSETLISKVYNQFIITTVNKKTLQVDIGNTSASQDLVINDLLPTASNNADLVLEIYGQLVCNINNCETAQSLITTLNSFLKDQAMESIIEEMLQIQTTLGWGQGNSETYAVVDRISQLITNNILPSKFPVQTRYLCKIIITLYMLLRAPSVFEAQSNMERLIENLTVFTSSPAPATEISMANQLTCGLATSDLSIFDPSLSLPAGGRYIMNNASRNTTFSTNASGTIANISLPHLKSPTNTPHMKQLHLNTIYEAQDPQSGSCFNTPSIPISIRQTRSALSIQFNMKFENPYNSVELYQHGDGVERNNMQDQCRIVFHGSGTSNNTATFNLTQMARTSGEIIPWNQFSKHQCSVLLNKILQQWVESTPSAKTAATESMAADPRLTERGWDHESRILYIIGIVSEQPGGIESLNELMHDIITTVLIKTKGDLFQLASSIHPQLATVVTHQRLAPRPIYPNAVDFTNLCNLNQDQITNPFDSDPKHISTITRAMLHNDNSATLLNVELSEAIIRGELERILSDPTATAATYNRKFALDSLITNGKMCVHYIIASTVSSSLTNSEAGRSGCPGGGCTNSYYNQKATACADAGILILCGAIGVNQSVPTGTTFAFNKPRQRRRRSKRRSRRPSKKRSKRRSRRPSKKRSKRRSRRPSKKRSKQRSRRPSKKRSKQRSKRRSRR